MFYDSELRLLENMLQKCHLQTTHIQPTLPLTEVLTYATQYLAAGGENKTFYDIFPDIRSHTIYHVTDTQFCRCIFLELPFCEPQTVLFVGPYLRTDITRSQILEMGEQLKLPPQKITMLETFYASLPVVRDEHHILAMVSSFADFLWNGEENYEYIEAMINDAAPLIDDDSHPHTDEDTVLQDIQAVETRYQYEHELLTAIEQGNIQKAEMMISGFSTVAFEERVPDRLRNMKNYCIITNTLFRKAAQNSGIHPIYIDRLSSRIAKKIESVLSPTAIPQFMIEIVRSYCRLVKEHAGKKYSPVVQKAIIKIEGDLAGDLSLSSIAAALNVSAGYLSGLFKKETGETLTTFVTDRRIAHAKHLLRCTSLQIQTVAQHCGILDLHYFCRVFKERTGETPTAFRARNR